MGVPLPLLKIKKTNGKRTIRIKRIGIGFRVTNGISNDWPERRTFLSKKVLARASSWNEKPSFISTGL